MNPSSPARFGYTILAATFICQAVALGFSLGIYPVMMASLESEFALSRTQSSLGIPMLFLATVLVSPVLGRWIDRGSVRGIMVCGALLMSAGLAAISAAPTFWLALGLWVVAVGTGQAMFGPLPCTTVLANWFEKRRATMIAISAVGLTVGTGFAPLLTEFLIGQFGWRSALQLLGLVCALLTVPTILFAIVKTPQERGMNPDGALAAPHLSDVRGIVSTPGAPIIRDPRFWIIAGAYACMSGISIAYLTHVVEWATESGIGREMAVSLLSLNAVCALLGKLVFGYLSDRIGPRPAVMISISLQCAGWTLLLGASGFAMFAGGAMLYSTGLGAIVPTQAKLIGMVWSLSQFGQAMGLVSAVQIVGSFLFTPLVGLGYDMGDSYALPMTALLLPMLLPLLLLGTLRLKARPAPAPQS